MFCLNQLDSPVQGFQSKSHAVIHQLGEIRPLGYEIRGVFKTLTNEEDISVILSTTFVFKIDLEAGIIDKKVLMQLHKGAS